MSEKTASVPVSESAPVSQRGPRWWVVAVAVLVALGVGLGLGYLVFESNPSDGARGGVSSDEYERVVATLDAYETAWNANDVEAVLELFSDDFVQAPGFTVDASRASLRNAMAHSAEGGVRWEYVGDPFVVRTVGENGEFDVAAMWLEFFEGSEDIREGTTTYRLVDDGDVFKIYRASPFYDWFRY